jgi:hypothetical protein
MRFDPTLSLRTDFRSRNALEPRSMSITPNPPGQTPGKPIDQQPPGDDRAPGANPTHPDRAPQTNPADRKPGEASGGSGFKPGQ